MQDIELYEGAAKIRVHTEAATYVLHEQDGSLVVLMEHNSGPLKALAVVGQASNVIHIRTVGM